MNNKVWVCNGVSNDEVLKISREAGISSLMAKIFLNRGITNAGCIDRFLNPSLNDMYTPFLMKDMDRAVDRIERAIRDRERIMVYGDYDVDGITSTSILTDFLLKQNAIVDYYIPDRIDNGYGLSISAIDEILQSDVSLIITVDCGITAIEEVNYINEKNIDIILTDHHKCKDELPNAFAVINPCRPDCSYPFKQLAGVGVVYKLINALCIKLELGELYNGYLDLVALGTVADVVPLFNT